MHTVDLTPIYQAFDQTIVLVLGGVILWLGAWGRKLITEHLSLLGQQQDKILADGFERALRNGAAIAMNSLDDYEKAHATADVHGLLASAAAQYAIDHSPDYMDRFGLTPDQIATKALAYLPPAPSVASAPPVKTVPVEVKPLPPAS